MKKNKPWIILIVVIFVTCAVLSAYILINQNDATEAHIYLKGDCIQVIDLNQVVIPYTIEIKGETITNHIRVEHGKICVIDADCPDKICVETGWISKSGIPIVCLPNQLVIEVHSSDSEIDSVSK